MHTQALITFYIPFYKNKAYLLKAITSVFAQTDSRWSLMISNDASSELSEADIEPFQNRGHRIEYVKHAQNIGMVANWNFGLQNCQTPYLCILHNDDELGPDYLKDMLLSAEHYPQASALYCQAQVIDGNSQNAFSFADRIKKILTPSPNKTIVLQSEAAVCQLLRGNFIFCPSVCFRLSKVKEYKFSKRWSFLPDLELWLNLLEDSHQIVGIPGLHYKYRRHTENTTKLLTINNERFIEELKFYKELAQKYRQRQWTSAAQLAGNATIVKLNIIYNAVMELLNFNIQGALKKLGLLRRF